MVTDPTPPLKGTRFASLDAARGIACLMVVVYHAVYALHSDAEYVAASAAERIVLRISSMGHVGVALFFVISGYCICAAADSTGRGAVSARDFVIRRFRRIYPPYWAALVASLALFALLAALGLPIYEQAFHANPSPRALSFWSWLGTITLTEQWRYHVVGPEPRWFLGHAWTLAYEEQFYALVCGLVLLAPRRLFGGMLVVTVIAVLAFPLGGLVRGFLIDGNWFLFVAGVGAYYALHRASRVGARVIQGLLAAAAIAAAVLGKSELPVAMAFGLALTLLHRHDAALAATGPMRGLRRVGRISYSLYLVHLPVALAVGCAIPHLGLTHGPLVAASIASILLLSIGAAWGLYTAVERRFMRSTAETSRP